MVVQAKKLNRKKKLPGKNRQLKEFAANNPSLDNLLETKGVEEVRHISKKSAIIKLGDGTDLKYMAGKHGEILSEEEQQKALDSLACQKTVSDLSGVQYLPEAKFHLKIPGLVHLPYVTGDYLGEKAPAGKILELYAGFEDTLTEVHKRGILHRDIKPSNLVHHKTEDMNDVLVAIDWDVAATYERDDYERGKHKIPGTTGYIWPWENRSRDFYALGMSFLKNMYGNEEGRIQQFSIPYGEAEDFIETQFNTLYKDFGMDAALLFGKFMIKPAEYPHKNEAGILQVRKRLSGDSDKSDPDITEMVNSGEYNTPCPGKDYQDSTTQMHDAAQ